MATGNHRFKVRSQDAALNDYVIDEHGPGTILRDFQTMQDYVAKARPSLSKTGLLPMAGLPDLNAGLSHPLAVGLKRPQLRSYPNIQALFLLLRATGIAQTARESSGLTLHLDASISAKWEALNPTERWFSLLETWLLRADPTTVGEERVTELYTGVHRFAHLMFSHPRRRHAAELLRSIDYWPGYLNLAMLELFGLVEIKHGAAMRGKGWRVLGVILTPLGAALLRPLVNEVDDLLFPELTLYDSAEADQGSVLKSLFGPSFPAWRQTLDMPSWPFRTGTFLFKVSLGAGVWRRFSVAAEVDWDSFCWAILDAFGFDHDHLYFIEFQMPTGSLERLHHPYMDESPYASEVQIGALPLTEGDKLTFIYDLGEEWPFEMELEAILAEDAKEREGGVRFVAGGGEAPEQYKQMGW